MNIRLEKVSSQMMREISSIVSQDMADPRLRGFVTISKVHPAPDLKSAQVHFSVIGSDTDKRLTEKALKGSSGFIQKTMAKRLNLKYTPVLSFVYDDSSEVAARITNPDDEQPDDLTELM